MFWKAKLRSRSDRAVAASMAGPIESLEMRLHLSSSKVNWPWVADSFPTLTANEHASATAFRPVTSLAGWLREQSGSTVLGPVASAPAVPIDPVAKPIAVADDFEPFGTSPSASALTPAQIRHAYGVDQVFFGSVQGDGTGQTIAIIDAYDYPSAFSDLNTFSLQFGLPTLAAYPSSSPYFRKVSQTGSSTSLPTASGSTGWSIEAALDIEWAHVMAPGANILLVEANGPTNSNLISAAVNWARNQPGVVAVSMSFGLAEFGTESSLDSTFTTPSGHAGVTFLAATGDAGQPSTWPAYSPNVVAVGGTTLNVSGTNYVSESGWSGSGGGISAFESQPSWQNGVVTQSTTKRTNPDVALNADPASGVPIYDSYDFPGSPWAQYGGTSLATPMWAGLMAIAAQGRAIASLPPLDGATQTLPAIYQQLTAADFHDITSGSNGFAAGVGYDLVTGRGTPIASKLINDLIGVGSISGAVYDDRNGTGVHDAGDLALAGTTVYLDTNDNGVLDAGTVVSGTSTDVPKSIPTGSNGVTSSLAVSGINDPITDVNITLSIAHGRLSDLSGYLIGPDNTTVELFTGLTGVNLTGTTFDDQSTATITSSSAPYTATFHPLLGVLAAFTGKTGTAANGTWKLKIVDNVAGTSGTITAWSMSITAGAEATTTVGVGGAYSFNGVAYGSYVVRQVVPANYTQITPAPGGTPPQGRTVSVAGNVAGQDFVDAFPGSISGEVFNDANSNGLVDAGEAGVSGWIVYLDTNGNGQLDTGETSQTTDSNGGYSFAGLASEMYTVGIAPRAGYQVTSPAGGSYAVQAQADSTVTGKNFGSFQLGSIAGQVFVDSNGNGTLDAGEAGLAGWTVYLDTNGNGALDTGEPSQTTTSNGSYVFADLLPGTYRVSMVTQPGYELIAPAGGSFSIAVVSGTAASGKNFANFQPGSISGQVFADLNGNGLRDGVEAGAVGWTIYLDSNGNGVFDNGETSRVTDAAGDYVFTGLLAGTYSVHIVQPSGYLTTHPTGGSYAVQVSSGTLATANDFGSFLSGSISGQVFTDTNGNGVLDAGETGAAGWTVYLDTNGNGAFDTGEPSAVTAGGGNYSFTGLAAGTHIVRIVQQAGYQTTAPAGGAYSVPVEWGTVTTANNFGSFQLGSIAGQVFTDSNGNGTLDTGEAGLAGWTVYLDSNDNGALDAGEPSRVSAANGSNSFTGLLAGTYTVRIIQQAGYLPISPAGSLYVVAVQSGTAATALNFANFLPGSIAGQLFTDTNGNGVLDAGETGLAGWRAYLDSNGNGQFDTEEASQLTGADGSYLFTGLLAGNYAVRIVQQAGYQLTNPVAGAYSVLVQSGTVATARNFADFQPGSISGQVFTDTNGNGQLDAGESGLSGWIVYLDTNNNGQLDGGETYRISDASGDYSFTGLAAGTYMVRVVEQAGYQTTRPVGGVYAVPVESGTAAASEDFGSFQPGSISGEVFADSNGNGSLDAGDAGLAGWTVYLDTNSNGQLDPGETSQSTAASGGYNFGGLLAGAYVVSVVPQAGYQATSPAGGSYTAQVQAGTAVTQRNFGNFLPGLISGVVFSDTNGNGTRDGNEVGLGGWTVYLDANNNDALDPGETSQITPADGSYSFNGLLAGTDTLRIVAQAGYQTTGPTGGYYTILVQSGTMATGMNFGSFLPGSISGEVFTDSNGNAQLDAGESGLGGWIVYLDANKNRQFDGGETYGITDANGDYAFTSLSAGTYVVRVVQRAGYQTTDPAGGAYSVPVQSGTVVTNSNFGSFQLGSISGKVFADTNSNDQLDTGETGLANWSAYLDANGNGQLDAGETSQLTDTNGDYSFAGLLAGTYTVRVVQEAGYQATSPASGVFLVPIESGTARIANDFGQQAISVVPNTPNLTLASDTGISHTDQLTRLNNSTPGQALQFSVGNTVAGATVTLYANGQAIGSAVATSMTTVIATDGTTILTDGQHTFAASQTEPGKAASATSPGQIVTILTAGPAAPALAPSLASGSDTGVSASDNITANLTPTFISTAAPYFRLYRNGVQISGDFEAASYTVGAQSNGTSNFTVTAVDAAGNESSQSPGITVTFDTTAPIATIDPTASNPVAGPVDPMQIAFTKAAYGFDLSHLSLSRDGFAIPLTAATLTTSDQIHYSLADLAGLTSLPGTYVLSATNTGVTDAAGNTMGNTPIQTWTNSLLAGTNGDDQVKIVRDVADGTLADVYVNSASPSFQLRFSNLPLLQASLGDGNDTLTVDFSNGNPLPAGQNAYYDGGTGNNVLAVVSPPGGNALTAEPSQFVFNTTPISLAGVESVMPISSDGKDTLTVAAGASLKLAALPYKTLFVSGLTIAGDGTLDLGDNGLVLAYGASSPLAQLTQDIVNGVEGLAGPKLIATAITDRPSALGLVDNQMLHLPTWAGRQIDDGTHHQIIVKFTYAGDANLDGQVTQGDLYNVFANQGASGGWLAGDVNLDGDIDPDDLRIVLANMGAGTGGVNGPQL